MYLATAKMNGRASGYHSSILYFYSNKCCIKHVHSLLLQKAFDEESDGLHCLKRCVTAMLRKYCTSLVMCEAISLLSGLITRVVVTAILCLPVRFPTINQLINQSAVKTHMVKISHDQKRRTCANLSRPKRSNNIASCTHSMNVRLRGEYQVLISHLFLRVRLCMNALPTLSLVPPLTQRA